MAAASCSTLRELEQLRRHQHHARRCQQLIGVLPAAESGICYLRAKGLAASPGTYQDKRGRLIVPIQDAVGTIWSIQGISAGGFRCLKKGARKAGLFHVLNPAVMQPGKAVLIVEGYATGASPAAATGLPVTVAFDAYNLAAAAKAVKERNPECPIGILGDDDPAKPVHGKLRNVGREQAEGAAQAVEGHALFRRFGNDRSQDQSQEPLKVSP